MIDIMELIGAAVLVGVIWHYMNKSNSYSIEPEREMQKIRAKTEEPLAYYIFCESVGLTPFEEESLKVYAGHNWEQYKKLRKWIEDYKNNKYK